MVRIIVFTDLRGDVHFKSRQSVLPRLLYLLGLTFRSTSHRESDVFLPGQTLASSETIVFRANDRPITRMLRDLELVVCLLLFSTYTVCTVLGFIKATCPQGCECISLSAHCRGDNNTYVDAVNSLPTSIENFTFTAFAGEPSHAIKVDLSAANLSRLHNLVSFRIQPVSQMFYRDYTLSYTGTDITIFYGLQHLKALHINTEIDPVIVKASAVECLKNLVVLDLSYTTILFGLYCTIYYLPHFARLCHTLSY